MHRTHGRPILLCVLIVSLAGCSSPPADSIEVANLVTPYRVLEYVEAEFSFLMSATWLDAEESHATLRDDRMPDWAADRYEHCLYWECRLEFERYRAVRQTEYATASAWVLSNRQGQLEFLEIVFAIDDGLRYVFVDAWDEQDHET